MTTATSQPKVPDLTRRGPARGFGPLLLSSASTLALLLALGPAEAVTITLTGNDPVGSTSFTTGTRWSDGLAPTAGKDYLVNVNGRILRSPQTTGTASFPGGSLTLTNGARLYIKTSVVDFPSASPTTLSNGGLILNAGTGPTGGTQTARLTGVITLGAGGGALDIGVFNDAATGQMTVAATMGGSGDLTISNILGETNTAAVFTGWVGWESAQNYTGNTIVNATTALRQLNANTLSSGGAGIHTVNGQLQLNTFNAAINGLAGGAVTANNNGRVIGQATTGVQTLTLDGDDGQQSSFAGIIQGANLAVAKTGNSRQTFTGTNTYGQGTTISGGQLRAGSNGALSTGAVTVNGTGTLEIGNSVTVSNAATLVGRGDLTPHIEAVGGSTQGGALNLTGADNFNLSAGASAGNSLTVSGAVTDADNNDHTLNLLGAAGTTGTLSGAVSLDGTGIDTIAKSGDGTWNLNGVSTADQVSVSAGTLVVASTSNITGAATSDNVSVANGATLRQSGGQQFTTATQAGGYNVGGTLDLNGFAASLGWLNGTGAISNNGAGLTLGSSAGVDGSFSGVIAGTGGLTKTGTNTQTLSGANSYTGTTTVEDGTLVVASDSALGNASAAGTVVTGTGSGTVDFDGSGGDLTINESFELVGRTSATAHLNNVAGNNLVNGSVTLTDNPGVNGDERYNITSTAGVLNLGGGVTSTLVGDGRVLTLGGAGDGLIQGLALTGTAPHTVTKTGTGNWTINGADIANAAAIRTQGGVLTLADTTAIAGNTVFEIGTGATLDVSGVGSGFTLAADQIMQGDGTIVGNVTTLADSVISPGSSPGTLTFNGDLTINGTLSIEIDSLLSMDRLNVTGALNIANATLALDLGSLAYSTYYVFATYGSLVPGDGPFAAITGLRSYEIIYGYNGNQIALYTGDAPVPVPAPLALIGLGLFGLAAVRRRRPA